MLSSARLKQVVAVDRAGSFSAAAKVLNVTQSTLTKAVADVESDLGFSLFHRHARGVAATPEGREFLTRAERIVADLDILVEDAKARKAEADANLRIGIAPASLEGLYNRMVADLIRKHPEICLSLTALPIESGVRLLKQGDLDLLVAPTGDLRQDSDFALEPLGRMQACLFCRHGHPILELKKVSLKDVLKHRIIAADVSSVYTSRLFDLVVREGDDPHRRLHTIENFAIVANLVAHSDLFGIVSDAYAMSQSFQRRFALPAIELFEPIEFSAARLSRWMPSRAIRAGVSALKRNPPYC